MPIDHVIGGLTDIAERMAAASGRTYHLVSRPDQAFLHRLIDYAIATGYLRGRSVQRTSG